MPVAPSACLRPRSVSLPAGDGTRSPSGPNSTSGVSGCLSIPDVSTHLYVTSPSTLSSVSTIRINSMSGKSSSASVLRQSSKFRFLRSRIFFFASSRFDRTSLFSLIRLTRDALALFKIRSPPIKVIPSPASIGKR